MKLIPNDDPRLKVPAKAIEIFDIELRKFAYDLARFLYKLNGYGLAANQVGDDRNLCVVDFGAIKGQKSHQNMLFIANMEILSYSEKKMLYDESCLSFPNKYIKLERPKSIHVKVYDLYGKAREIQANDLFGRVLQHEYDHLSGKIISDYGNLEEISSKTGGFDK